MENNTTMTEERATEIREMIQKLETKASEFLKEISEKKYQLSEPKKVHSKLIHWAKNDIEWQDSECIGAEQVFDLLNKHKGTPDKFSLTSLEIRALSYFLKKITGKGIAVAKEWSFVFRELGTLIEAANADQEKYNQFIKDIGFLENALNVGALLENEKELFEEIKKTLES